MSEGLTPTQQGSLRTNASAQQITENLSDSISQLVLLVVALAEQNAPPPAELPAAAGSVGSAGDILVNVAIDLADNDYDGYPEIQKDIHDAADGVSKSSTNLVNSTNGLMKAADRAAGWAKLMDACKVISEMRKFLIDSERAKKALADLDASKAKGPTAQKFADDIGALTAQANDLAADLRDRAVDEDSPVRKRELEDTADKLERGVEDLVNSANRVLDKPDDPNARKAFDDDKKNLVDLIDHGRKLMEEQLREALPESAINQMFNKEPPPRAVETAKVASAPPSRPAPSAEPARAVDYDRAAKEANLAAAIAAVQADKNNQESAAFAGDRDGAKDEGVKLKEDKVTLDSAARDLLPNDPVVERALAKLNTLVPQHDQLAQAAAANPNDKAVAKNMADVGEQIEQALSELAKHALTPQAQVRILAPREEKAIDRQHDNIENKDGRAAIDQAKKIAGIQNDLLPAAREAARGIADPERRRDLEEAINELDSLLPNSIEATKAVLQNPNSEAAQDRLTEVLDTMSAPLDTVKHLGGGPTGDPVRDALLARKALQDEADAAERDLNRLKEAVRNRDGEGIAEAAHAVGKRKGNMQNLARAQAVATDEPDRRDEVNDAINQLGNVVPGDLEAVNAFLMNPDDPKAVQKVMDLSDAAINAFHAAADVASPKPQVEAAVHSKGLSDALEQLRHAAQTGDPDSTHLHKNEVANQAARLRDDALVAAHDAANPAVQKVVNNVLAALDAAVPAHLVLADRLQKNPNDPAVLKAVRDSEDKINALIDQLMDALKTDVLAEIDLTRDALRNENAAADADDKAGLGKNAHKVGKRGSRAVNKARAMGSRTDDPNQKARINQAADELDKKLHAADGPVALASVYAKDPSDRNYDRLQASIKDTNDKLDNLADAVTGANPDHRRRQETNRAADKLGALDDLQRLADLIRASADELETNPKDSDALANMSQALDDLKAPLDTLGLSKFPPGERVALLVKSAGEALEMLNDRALAGDKDGVAQAGTILADLTKVCRYLTFKELADVVAAGLPTLTPEQQREVKAAMEDFQRRLPTQLKNADNVVNSPNNEDAKRNLLDNADQMFKDLDVIGAAFNPTPHQKIWNDGNKAGAHADEVKRGGPQAVAAARALADDVAKFAPAAHAAAAHLPPAEARRVNNAAAKVDKLAEDIQAKLARGDEAGAAKDATELQKLVKEIQEATLAEALAAIDREKELLNQAAAAGGRGDKDGVAAADAALKQHHPYMNKVVNSVKARLPGDAQKVVDRALGELDKNVPAQLEAARVLSADPDNSEKRKALNLHAAENNQSIADLKNALQGSKDHDLQALAARALAELAKTQAAADKRDVPDTNDHKDKTVDAARALLAAAKSAAAPGTDDGLEDAINRLEGDLAKFPAAAEAAAKEPNGQDNAHKKLDNLAGSMKEAIEQIAGIIAPEDRVLDDKDKIAGITASMRRNLRKRPPKINDLIGAGRHLADLLDEMIKRLKLDAYAAAQDGGEMAKAATDLDSLLSRLESGDVQDHEELGTLLDKIDDLSKKLKPKQAAPAPQPAKAAPRSAAAPAPASSSKGFDGGLDGIAAELEAAVRARPDFSKDSTAITIGKIAQQLQRLAKAAREGDRQTILICGRTINALIVAYMPNMTKLQQNCKDPRFQDQLFRNGKVLRTFGTQLKILCSVKAATIGVDGDADEQLLTLCSSLGACCSNTVETVHKGKEGRLIPANIDGQLQDIS